MPPSSQTGRPRLVKQSSSQQSDNRNIRDFFKPFTIPKNRIPANDVVEDEIVVSTPRKRSSQGGRRSDSPLSSPIKSQSSVGQTKAPSGRFAPYKRTRSPVKRSDRAVQLDGADDELNLHHESPSGSQQRVMAAVEIPAPRKRASPPPPAPTQQSTGAAAMNNTSFTSMSSLTSMPLSSQASSSRRIVKDGVPIVTNSDSGSADDSEDELPDIVIPRKKIRLTPPGEDKNHAAEQPSTVKPAKRQSDRISAGRKSQDSSRSHTPRLRRSQSPISRPANMSSLLQLVREKEKREKADAKILETEAAFEGEQKRREEQMQRDRDLGGGLKALVADDSDEGERMMLAVERTEAMGSIDEDWFYFKGVRDDVDERQPRSEEVLAFTPWAAPKFARLKAMVVDAEQREQACLSGFLAEITARHSLPRTMLDWMFRRLVREPRDELCEAYVEIMRRYFQRSEGTRLQADEDWARLSRLYRTTMASSGEGERRTEGSTATAAGPPPGLRHVVRVIEDACSEPKGPVPHRNLLELALANVDSHVVSDAALRGQLQESMAYIIESKSTSGVSAFASALSNETLCLPLPLRCRIVAALPPQTPNSHRLRRILALHLIADRPFPKATKHVANPLDRDPAWHTTLLTRLRTAPEWTISESTNYAHLNALIPILDIALDAGFALSSNPSKPDADEKAFNARVDACTDALRALAARIRDAGTSHLRRTEAKSALERLVVRLEHCVRTRPRPRKGVFGGPAMAQTGLFGAGFFQVRPVVDGVGGGGGSLRDRPSGKHPEDRVSVVDVDKLSDRGGDSQAEEGADKEDDEEDEEEL